MGAFLVVEPKTLLKSDTEIGTAVKTTQIEQMTPNLERLPPPPLSSPIKGEEVNSVPSPLVGEGEGAVLTGYAWPGFPPPIGSRTGSVRDLMTSFYETIRVDCEPISMLMVKYP